MRANVRNGNDRTRGSNVRVRANDQRNAKRVQTQNGDPRNHRLKNQNDHRACACVKTQQCNENETNTCVPDRSQTNMRKTDERKTCACGAVRNAGGANNRSITCVRQTTSARVANNRSNAANVRGRSTTRYACNERASKRTNDPQNGKRKPK